MKKYFHLIVAALLLIVFGSAPAASAMVTNTIPNPIDYWVHIVIACGTEPDQVDIRFKPDMNQVVLVDGEIFAQQGEVTHKIGGMPTEESQITQPFTWNGPEGSIANYFTGFSGIVTGWGKIYLLDGTLLGSFNLPPIPVTCGQPVIDFLIHVVAACGTEPNQVEIRFMPDMNQTVKVDGEIFAQQGEVTHKIGGMPTEESKITSPFTWNGPEGRITDYFTDFAGVVWGWGKITTLTGSLLGSIEVPTLPIVCDSSPQLHRTYLPIVTNAKPFALNCADITMQVDIPGYISVSKPFGEAPGPTYSFGDALIAGTIVHFEMTDGLPVDQSYLGWFNSYTRDTGVGPKWDLQATSFEGEPPLLATLYTWQAVRSLSDGTRCSLGFIIQWDP